jgi:KDO2-lipid IV(A) lauroyltransferase
MAKNHMQPQFTAELLHPRYWLTWLGLAVLYLIVLLPYPVIRQIGFCFGSLSKSLVKRRFNIAYRNLELCFPDMPEQQRLDLVKRNFRSTGLALFETGMAWFWSDRRIKKWCSAQGVDNLMNGLQQGRGVLLIGIHFLTLELGARVIGLYHPGVGVYRPHDNKLMDWVQTWGRLRSNKYMLDRKDLKGMIRALKEGELLWYAPDHDYGPKSSVFAPLFAVEKAATTVGTSLLMRMTNAVIIPFTPKRNDDNSGYTLLIQPELQGFPLDDQVAAAAFMNKAIEHEILQAMDQYMWLHRRFKTRPEGEPPLY